MTRRDADPLTLDEAGGEPISPAEAWLAAVLRRDRKAAWRASWAMYDFLTGVSATPRFVLRREPWWRRLRAWWRQR